MQIKFYEAMFEKLYKLIKKNEVRGDFTYAIVTDDLLNIAEKRLGLVIPQEYKWFLRNFGHGGIGGLEVLGIDWNERMVFVDATLEYRKYGLPNELIAVENCDEWLYCLNTQNNKIVMWSLGGQGITDAYESFEEYLIDRIHDILENMD